MTDSSGPAVGRRGLLTAALVAPVSGSAGVPATSSSAVLDPRHFGAAADGVADDSGAVQAAIDTCLQSDPPSMLVITGRLRITRSLTVRRRVDRSRGRFRIVGAGGTPAFVTDRAIALFRADDVGKSPSSEFLSFENVRFEASDPTLGAHVMTGAFLRVEFAGCDFHAITCLDSPIYAQEWRFHRCIARYWKGAFFRSAGGYAVTSHGSKYQHGGSVFEIADPTGATGCVGCSFHQDIVESSFGPFLTASYVQGLSVSALYAEGNGNPTISLGATGPNRGVTISGCFFAPQAGNRGLVEFFDVQWGRTVAGFASGNEALGGLHDNALAGTGLVSMGDHSEGKLTRVSHSPFAALPPVPGTGN